MMQNASANAEFVTALKADIRGIYFTTVRHYKPEQIEDQFRKAVADPALVADEDFMTNLMFLVRKKEVAALRDDVGRVLAGTRLPPRAEVSSLKTFYALGTARERAPVDQFLARRLAEVLKAERNVQEYLDWADRIGGRQTLAVLESGLAATTARQRAAEAADPQDHDLVSRLDGLRSALENQSWNLSRKMEVSGLPEADQAAAMVNHYLRRSGHLGFWAYKELVDHPTPVAVGAVRAFIHGNVRSLVPAGLPEEQQSEMVQDLRLRGLCLLEAMKALRPEEQEFLARYEALLTARKEFFRPGYDWEDVLDRQ